MHFIVLVHMHAARTFVFVQSTVGIFFLLSLVGSGLGGGLGCGFNRFMWFLHRYTPTRFSRLYSVHFRLVPFRSEMYLCFFFFAFLGTGEALLID